MIVNIFDHDLCVGTIKLPNGKVSTAYIKGNWAAIISGPLLNLLAGNCAPFTYQDLGLTKHADYVAWLQDPSNWKRGHKSKLADGDEQYWGVTQSVKDCVHRMYWTDQFQDGMDLNFVSSPKDAHLLSIHLHSD